VGQLLRVGRQRICSSVAQVVCLWDAPNTLFTDWRYFYPNFQLEVIFSSYKLYHRVFTSWEHQRPGPLLSPSCAAGNLALPSESLPGSIPYCTVWGRGKCFLIALGPGVWPGNLYCSFLSRDERILFVVAIAEFLDILF